MADDQPVNVPTNGNESDHDRLQRLCRQVVEEELAGAALELSSWCQTGQAPPEAYTLLAGCLAREGRIDDAIDLLEHQHRMPSEQVPCETQMLIALLTVRGRDMRVAHHVKALEAGHGNDPAVAAWLDITHMPGAKADRQRIDPAADQLADDLFTRQQLVPTLVAAQKIQPDARQIASLRSALAILVNRAGNDHAVLPLITGLAELALLAGDGDDARRWAHRGLEQHPYLAPLALVLAQLPDDQDQPGRTAADALAGVRARHPDYADVRAALIRRQHHDGRDDLARLEISQWLEDEPDHPIAGRLDREIAA